jgi:putative transposase
MVDRTRYRRGAHTVTDLKYHIVWKTKYGYPVLRGEIGLRLRDVLRMIYAEHDMIIVQGNIRPNHVHLLVSGPTYLSPAKMLQYLKGKSSYRLQREFRELQKRYWGQHLWGRGYFCVTVRAVTEEQVKRYIEEQEDESGAFPVWDEPPTPTE